MWLHFIQVTQKVDGEPAGTFQAMWNHRIEFTHPSIFYTCLIKLRVIEAYDPELSQLLLDERQGTPWTGRQSVTGRMDSAKLNKIITTVTCHNAFWDIYETALRGVTIVMAAFICITKYRLKEGFQ